MTRTISQWKSNLYRGGCGLSPKIEDLSLRDFFKVLKAKGRGDEAEALKKRLLTELSGDFSEEDILGMRYSEALTLLRVCNAMVSTIIGEPVNPLEQRIHALQAQGYAVYYNPDKVRSHGSPHPR